MKTILSVLFFALCGSLSVYGDGMLKFSGGLGSPLTLTLSQPVRYTVTSAGPSGYAPFFVFDGVGNYFSNFPTASGSITYRVNSATYTLNMFGSGQTLGAVTADDIDLYNQNNKPGVQVGDVVTLLAGSMTTSAAYAGNRPADGSFPTFLAMTGGDRISTFGVPPVPEPSTWALTIGAAVVIVLAACRRPGTS